MSSQNKDERAHVNALIKVLQAKEPLMYVHIDRDAGTVRHTSSGYDFLLSFEGRVVFCEAKEKRGNLSDWQKFTQALIKASKSPYRVVRFWEDGELFTVDEEKTIAIKDACLQDFF